MTNGFPYGICCDTVVRIEQVRIPEQIAEKVYEVMRVIDGKVLYFEEHLDRMAESIRFFVPEMALDRDKVKQLVGELIERNGVRQVNLRIEGYLRDGHHLDLIGYLLEGHYPDRTQYEQGVCVGSYEHERVNPGVKTIDLEYKRRVAAFIEKEALYEAVLHHDGLVTEGSRSNLFLIKDGKILSARRQDILSGITRQKVIETIGELGMSLVETDLSLEMLRRCEAAFLTGTSIHILPIREVDGFALDVDHPMLRTLMDGFGKRLAEELNKTGGKR